MAHRLSFERLEDRLTPAGTRIPAGEFNWTQYGPTGTLGQLIWDGQALVYRTRSGGDWQTETVAASDDFTRPQYDTVEQIQAASQTAQLVFTADGTAHALFLEKDYHWRTKTHQTLIRHYARTAAGWKLAETIAPPWESAWGPNNLVAAAGSGNSLHLLFTDTSVAATAAGKPGAGSLWYATNAAGAWTFDKVADTTDLRVDVWYKGGRWTPRFLSLAVDAGGAAHVTYTPEFYVRGAFSTVRSELRYATNAGGAWRSETVVGSLDGTGDAALGAAVAVAPNGRVAVASYYVDRYPTGSPQKSWLMYHARNAGGGWTRTDVVSDPDGYAAGDGPHFTGFAPQLSFDAASRPTIVFSDDAGDHLPVSYANQFAGQIRTATLAGNAWSVRTVYRQTDPLVNQLFYPVAATYDGRTVYAGVRAVSTLDGDKNPVRTDFSLVDVNAPDAAPPPPSHAEAPPVLAPPLVTAPATPRRVGPVAVAATEAGTPTVVRVTDADGSSYWWAPFGSRFTGGAAVARADLTGDGIPDVVVASGRGTAGRVQVWDGATRQLVATYRPFGNFAGGLSVAAGDVTGDGRPDLVAGVAGNGPPLVAVIDGATGRRVRTLLAYGVGFTGGVRVAAADLDGDGFADIVSAGSGVPRRAFSGAAVLTGGAEALDPLPAAAGGIFVG